MYFRRFLLILVLCMACSPKKPPPQITTQAGQHKKSAPAVSPQKIRHETKLDQLPQTQSTVLQKPAKVTDPNGQQRCIKKCLQRRQAEAISAQMIENQCQQSCTSDPTPRPLKLMGK